jgi:exopolysaccharide production protein ExoZ
MGGFRHLRFTAFAGVDVFFVLSGFVVMVAIAADGVGPAQFLWRRAVRIYPTYWLVTAVVLCVSLVSPASVNASITAPISTWRSFLLVPQEMPPLLAVGWTLVHEAYFYLVFAILLFFRASILSGLTMWAACLSVLILVLPVGASPALRVITSPLTAEFMMGAIVGVLYRQAIAIGGRSLLVVGLVVLAWNMLWTAPELSLSTNPSLDLWRVLLFGVPAVAIFYGLSAWELRSAPKLPALLVALGDYSYATYLLHVLVVSAIGRLIALMAGPGIAATCVLLVAGFIVANAAGALTHHFFERPNIVLLREIGRWRTLKRHIIRMKYGLDLVETTLREERECGIAITEETARKRRRPSRRASRRAMRGH